MRDTVLEQQPEEHDSISVESPTQSLPPKRGAAHDRARNFLPHAQEGSQWDHWPHSNHSPSIPGFNNTNVNQSEE